MFCNIILSKKPSVLPSKHNIRPGPWPSSVSSTFKTDGIKLLITDHFQNGQNGRRHMAHLTDHPSPTKNSSVQKRHSSPTMDKCTWEVLYRWHRVVLGKSWKGQCPNQHPLCPLPAHYETRCLRLGTDPQVNSRSSGCREPGAATPLKPQGELTRSTGHLRPTCTPGSQRS